MSQLIYWKKHTALLAFLLGNSTGGVPEIKNVKPAQESQTQHPVALCGCSTKSPRVKCKVHAGHQNN